MFAAAAELVVANAPTAGALALVGALARQMYRQMADLRRNETDLRAEFTRERAALRAECATEREQDRAEIAALDRKVDRLERQARAGAR